MKGTSLVYIWLLTASFLFVALSPVSLCRNYDLNFLMKQYYAPTFPITTYKKKNYKSKVIAQRENLSLILLAIFYNAYYFF